MRNIALKIACSSLFLFSFSAAAVTASSNSEQGSDLSSGNQTPLLQSNPVWELVKVLIALVVVIALLMVTVKWLSKRNRAWSSQKGVRSLGGISLGQNSSLQIIEMADRIYVIGVGDQITLIDKEMDPEQVEVIIEALNIGEQNNMSLASLKGLFTSKGKKSENSESLNRYSTDMWNERGSFEDLLQAKLDKQSERKQELESILKDKK